MSCVVTPLSTSVSWYYTTDPVNAGLQGDELVHNIDGYSVIDNSIGTSRIVNLGFTVSNLTTGFYWCGITSGDYRPSTITPICTHFNSTLPMCDGFNVGQQIIDVHYSETECAEVGSPTQFPRPPFPDNCVVVPSPSIVSTTDIIFSDSSMLLKSPQPTIITMLSSPSLLFSSHTISSSIQSFSTSTSDHIVESTRSETSDSSSLYTLSTPGVTSDQSSNEQTLLFILIGVCVFLAVVATIICGAITILCFLTRAHQSHDTSTPQGIMIFIVELVQHQEFWCGLYYCQQLYSQEWLVW